MALTQVYTDTEVSKMKTRISRPRNANTLNNLITKAVLAKEVIRVKNHTGNAVIMSESEYDNLIENLYIRSDVNNYSHLVRAINQLESGECSVHELLNDEQNIR
ncbi:MAG: hypothetical protein LBB94_03975 [Clostridiales bacterium]|jgi:antitoxin YefM|nr:hypothetical protein [Clostridiales bacterium]